MRSLVVVSSLAEEGFSSVSTDVAATCKDTLVASVVAKPFTFEGTRKAAAATRTLKAVWGISDTVVLIDQERLMQSAGGLTVQSAFEAAEGAMLQAAQAVVDLVPSSGVTDARTAAAVDSLEALRSPSRHTFFGAGRAPLRAGGGAGETAVSVATAVSAAVHDAMGSPFLGPGALAVAQQVVCLVGVPPAAAAAWEAVCRAAAADTVAALVGPGCRAEFVAVEAAPEGADSAASTEVSARLLVSAVQPAGSGTAPSIASANTAAAAMEMGGAAGDDARPAAGSWRRDAMSKLAGGSRLRSWDAAHKAQAAAAAPAAAVTAAAAQAAPAPQAAAEAAAPPKPQPPPPALETSGVGRGEGSGLKKTTQLSPKGAPFAGAAESAAPPPPPAAAAALAAPKESPAPEPATPAPVAAAAAAVAPPDEPEAPQQPPRPAAPAAAASSAAAAAAAVDSLASASSAAAATSRPAPAPSSPGRPNWGDSDQPPVLDDILRGDFSDSSSEGDGESVGDWEDVEEDQRGGLPLLGWFKKARKKKRPEASLRAAVRSRTAKLLASDRAATRSVARMEFADGTVYEGEVSASGQMEGRGRVLYPNGNWYAGEWKAGRRHGYGMSYVGGVRKEGRWENGAPVSA